jgi:branched-chain amino acid aminotransferase
MGELAPVTEVDGRMIGDGQTGPVTSRLASAFAALTAREGTVVVDAPSATP